MAKLLISSDLHLSVQEKEYSLSVLDEIMEYAKDYDALMLLGDTFNTFEDLQGLKDVFSQKIEDYQKDVYLLKGNHENLKAKGITLNKLKFPDNVIVIEDISFFNIDNLDIIALPYSEKYIIDNDINKKIESLNADNRIVIAHGIVEGTLWAIEENEEAASIPIDIIKKIDPNIAIVGHIHKQMEVNIENIEIIYTGSARVWRKTKSEMGIRRCLAIDTKNNSIKKTFINIKNAGVYRVYESNIYNISNIEQKAPEWDINDIIDVNIYGIAEDENELEEKINNIKNKYSKYVRDFNIKTSDIFLLENAYNESIIKEFLSIADEYEFNTNNEEDLEIVEIAKRIGIEKIYTALQNNKR
ncbi:metallophosphoesterase family protein [Brachyspira hyodysenteriae]|uniref:metallophosphoesterase family protein n=1 Tax=Brachyspira hyodysenteriae TaxID=159 RepID=UPI00063DD254|nr:metallophosphoesterase [Brachyspira hyodysenteriae]KLI16398.1 exonuclease [Brachyspira hyodysenteriae]KLI48367.1 exonuclease [Brachyspira hyodysenteriae]MCZ9960720.1 metallophosphoesterase family protein [Brachyspira hyodysenteriae]MCZ9980410.1 metallophosphoesterase family protein [Brachyspira hyodysenteriae]